MGLRVRPAEPSAAYPGPTKYEGFKKNVLRARRTRGPKMAKIQNSKNPIRSAQNVGQVQINMGDGFKNQKRVILDQKSRNIKNPNDPSVTLTRGFFHDLVCTFYGFSVTPTDVSMSDLFI